MSPSAGCPSGNATGLVEIIPKIVPALILASTGFAASAAIALASKENLIPGIIEEITPFLNEDIFKVALIGTKCCSTFSSLFNLGTILDILIAAVFSVTPLIYSTA